VRALLKLSSSQSVNQFNSRGIYKSVPRWRESANDGSKTSCALPHRSNREAPKALYSLYCSSKQPTIHYIAPKASVNSPRLSKVTGCRPSKRRDIYSFSILSISISFSILKLLSQSLLWIFSSSFLLPLEYKSRSVLLPPIMCSSELVFQVSLIVNVLCKTTSPKACT
jgi:hypothetical protein